MVNYTILPTPSSIFPLSPHKERAQRRVEYDVEGVGNEYGIMISPRAETSGESIGVIRLTVVS